jgi:hypothetical protein
MPPAPIAQLLYDLQIVATPYQSLTLTDCGVKPLMFVTPGLPLGMLEIEPDCRCRNPILASGDMHELWLQLVPKRSGPDPMADEKNGILLSTMRLVSSRKELNTCGITQQSRTAIKGVPNIRIPSLCQPFCLQ